MKKLLILFSTILVAIGAVVAFLYADLQDFGRRPLREINAPKIVEIPAGEGLSAVARRLFDAGIISSSFKFKLLARLRGDDKRIKAGEYLLSPSISPNTILDATVAGKVYLHRLTVPEGYTLRQIAASIVKAGLGTENGFLRAATDPALVKSYGFSAGSFEGYLFPDTYSFPKQTTPAKIIAAMVERFNTVFTKGWRERAQTLGFSVHEIITLASIIEKETAVPEERPLISSVFHNRLKKGMRLESDPTVIYGIEDFDGNLTRRDLKSARPYNTYYIKGLPPGPIANPGVKAIEAALYPAETSYLYFVARKDKTHQFSANIQDHNRAVRQYQLK